MDIPRRRASSAGRVVRRYDDIDDIIADCWDGNGMDDCFSKEIDAGVVTQEEVIEARENWNIPEPTEDPDGPTCEDFQEWSWFGALCANPFPVPEGSTEAICTPEFDATMECVMEGILLDSGLACTFAAQSSRRQVATASRLRHGYSIEMSRGAAAAATRIFRGDESRRRRGRDVDRALTNRGDAAVATRIFL